MANTIYLVSVSTKGILPKGESAAMKELHRVLGAIDLVHGSDWELTPGIDEKIFRVSRPAGQLITGDEIKHLKMAFEKEHRMFDLFKLERA